MNDLTQEIMINAYKYLIKGMNDLAIKNFATDIYRRAGFLEACLVAEGVLKPDEKFIYNSKEHKFLWMRWKSWESYPEMIKRYCKKYFESQGIVLDEA